ncbi:capsid assembly protein [Caudoviricetes sp.]|nr:capsid assembly protein [Caudoviricetes sp.]
MSTEPPATPETDPSKPLENVIETAGGIQIVPKTETATEPAKKPEERPSWLPEKYKTPEDFAAAHKALEAKLGAPAAKKDEAPAPKVGDKPEPVSLETVGREVAEKGEVSEETLAKLETQGIPRKMVASYIAGQQALVAQQTADLASAVGGQENLKDLLTWAGKELTPAEIASYNSQIDAGNIAGAKLVLSAFVAKYEEQNGKPPVLVNGAPVKSSSEGGYGSSAEMTADMRNPKYQTDAAFRAKVAARLAVTTAF